MLHENKMDAFALHDRGTGRAIFVESDGTLYVSRGYTIWRSKDDGLTWSRLATIPVRGVRRLGITCRLAARLLRYETKCMTRLSDGSLVAANRQWVYFLPPGGGRMRPAVIDDAGPAFRPPMTITAGPADRVLWGEYNSALHRNPVRIFVSDDRGATYRVARVFEPGEILHVHSLVYDASSEHYWVMTGDFDAEPGIGRLSADLREFEWVRKGEQQVRAVEVFDLGDRLVYGTDTQLEPNAVVCFDKATGEVKRLVELDGSCIYACRFGGIYALSTTVEPSTVNQSSQAGLWISRDGETWRCVLRARKDRWNLKYFQYGSIVLPRGASDRESILFSGQALVGYDNRVMTATLKKGCRG
jgi:hypothetical protein